MTARKTRGAARRAKAIRFRFRAEGEDHRAVTVNVSATGAFLKASAVPQRGALVVLEELGQDRGRAVRLRGEVRWCIDRPTLDRPEPGFGLQFIAAWSPDGDEARLREFLGVLSPESEPEVVVRERDGVRVALHRFPPIDDGEEEQPSPGDAEQPAFESIDLDTELRHLEEEMEAPPRTRDAPLPLGGGDSDGSSPKTRPFDPLVRERLRRRVDTSRRGVARRVTEKPPTGDGGGLTAAMEAAARSPRSRPFTRPRVSTGRRGRADTQGGVTPEEAGTAPGSSQAAQAPSRGEAEAEPAEERSSAERGAKRRITGLFNAIFGAGRDDEEDDLAEATSRPPARGPGTADAVPVGATGVDVVVRWRERSIAARVVEISESMVSLVTAGEAPAYYERVSLAPTPRSGRGPEFMMFGTVTRVREATTSGERAFDVRFMKVDEKGQTGAFQEFLRYCSRG
ncbi:MAG: PilZ domain-containing protein [Myxococcota bacterium]